jgi:hypothetical protein
LGENWVRRGLDEAVREALKEMPEATSGTSANRKLLRRKARHTTMKARKFHATICQIFAEMLGAVCHTDNDFIEDEHEQTVRFILVIN